MILTDTFIRDLKPRAKMWRVFDERGLYLEISPKGSLLWKFRYRLAGKENRIAFGAYPKVPLKDARAFRDEARKLLATGVDPNEHRKATKRALPDLPADSFEIVAREWIIKYSRNWCELHTSGQLRRLARDIFPFLGPRPIGEITAPELLETIRRIERRSLETAHKALKACSQVFRYGIATGRCERDIAGVLKGSLPRFHGGHCAATTEPKRLGSILRLIDAYHGGLVVSCALRLAPLVFVRPGELRTAKWQDIDLEQAEWRYWVTKTRRQHIVPLSRQAVAILRELHPLTGKGNFVFPGARSTCLSMSNNAIRVALRILDVGVDEMSGHGFRAVARTILDEVLKFRPDIIEHQLSHLVKDPNGRAYNRTTHLAARREMMQVWADHLDFLKAATILPVQANGATDSGTVLFNSSPAAITNANSSLGRGHCRSWRRPIYTHRG